MSSGKNIRSTSLAASSNQWLSLVGINEDGLTGLSQRACNAIRQAEWIFGGERHLKLAESLINGQGQVWRSPLDESLDLIVSLKGQRVAVLASGDPFCYGIGSVLTRHIPIEQMSVFPALSSFSLACACLGWAQQNVSLVSLCGRPITLLESKLKHGSRLVLLTSGDKSPQEIMNYLVAHGFGKSQAVLLEALGGSQERVRHFRVDQFAINTEDINALNMVALDVRGTHVHENAVAKRVMDKEQSNVPSAAIMAPGRSSDCFNHDGQISRREVRALTLSRLQPGESETLWDLGAGSGAMAIEWLLCGNRLKAVTLESNESRLALIKRNAKQFSVDERLEIIAGRMPLALDGLKGQPHAIFVGGGADKHVISFAVDRLREGGRLVINAVTLESESLLAECFHRYGGDLTRIGLEHVSSLGHFNGWQPARTIMQWVWHKPSQQEVSP